MKKDQIQRENDIALFVYIPFCKTLCTYCDFNVYVHLNKLFEAYVEAVVAEVTTAAAQVPSPRRARSLAFGGGTPSILPVKLIEKLVEGISAEFALGNGIEISLEANPGTADLSKLQEYRALGVNRLSLGVQSFDDARLKAFNRNHDSAASRRSFSDARKAGFDNINLDLIFGLPDQTLENWASTLDEALAWQPEHMSLYGLQVEEATALYRQIARGRVTAPDDDLAADMYALAEDRLGAAGFEHYEISNYALPGHLSRHNLTYWKNENYIGFGAGAHSYFGDVRYSNLRDPAAYIERLGHGEPVVVSSERISVELAMGETLMLGLRLGEGISFKGFFERFGVDLRKLHRGTILKLEEWGLLAVDSESMRLTQRGRLLSNQVLWRFLPDAGDHLSRRTDLDAISTRW